MVFGRASYEIDERSGIVDNDYVEEPDTRVPTCCH